MKADNNLIEKMEGDIKALELRVQAKKRELAIIESRARGLKKCCEDLSTAAAMAVGALPNNSPIAAVCVVAVRAYNDNFSGLLTENKHQLNNFEIHEAAQALADTNSAYGLARKLAESRFLNVK